MKKKNISKTKPTTLLSEYSYKESVLNLAPNIFSIVGLLVAFYIGYWYAGYSKQLHENEMWFSNIKQVEREISFRTESGLYFSYYKQLVLAPTLLKGIHSLINDNLTEHLLTINILERFNIYQEVVLAAIYRILPSSIQKNWEYVYFYIDNIFGLHGAMMVTLFIAAWLLSGSPIAGLLANGFFIFHRPHMTRLFKTIPLRESFSLPFIFMQITLLTIFFRRNVRVSFEKPLLVLISLTTFAYTITWQFSQFVMLLQSFALFGVYALEFVETRKVKYVFWIFLGSLSTTCLLMFGNDMIYSSLVSSFCIASLLVMNVQNAKVEGSFLKKLFVLLLRIIVTLSLTMIISIIIKKIAKVESDTHVYKFVMTKFGYQDYSIMDFDVRLYLCNGGFDFMPFSELTDGLVYLFPVYFICMIIALVCLMVSFIESLRGAPGVLYNHPEIVFNVILNIFYAVLALSTQRMKFLWFPHMTVVAAGMFCNENAWKWLLEKFKFNSVFIWLINHSAPIIILALLVQKKLPGMKEELSNLFQFNDPDTVALMNWINTSTPPESSFTGTMQLLAGVKLCTSRPITNHPHYENKFLRQRTKELYQIYARRTPIDVYRILRKHGTNYIILENSICYSSSSCTLTKNLDIENGHDLNPLYKVPRFCDAIKRDSSFQRFFKEVFVNNTFYVYKLLNVEV